MLKKKVIDLHSDTFPPYLIANLLTNYSEGTPGQETDPSTLA